MDKPVTVLCTYRVQPGQEAAFEALLAKHHPTLLAEGLVTADRPQVFRGADGTGGPVYHELFAWLEEGSAELAHQSPAVLALWEPIGALCEAREGRPPCEFPHVEPVEIAYP